MMPHDPTPRRDPAPSRLSYRVQRWWLTPYVRRMVRVGLPLLVTCVGVLWFLSFEDNRNAIDEQISEIRRSVAERPEFQVKVMAIDGVSVGLGEEIRAEIAVDFPVSSFDLDLEAIKAKVEEFDAVASANLRVRSGGILQLNVIERVPAVVWRHERGLTLLDAEGRRVANIRHRADRYDLPLIVGEGADKAVSEALAILSAAEPLEARLRGLVRMGERRWDVALDRDQRILLPTDQPIPALEHVLALDQAKDVLERNITDVDMRSPARPTLRLADSAVEDLHRIRALELGGITQ